jgi:hypothetical protein
MEQPLDSGPLRGSQLVLATFEDRRQAGNAVQALRARGIPEQYISVVVRHDTPEVSVDAMAELDQEADEVGTDVALGSAAGGLAGFVAGLVLFSIPGLGQFLGVGVLASTLGGAALGSAMGERAANFMELGLPEERAARYGEALSAGHVVVAITAPDAEAVMVAREVLGEQGAEEIDMHPAPVDPGLPPTDAASTTRPGR